MFDVVIDPNNLVDLLTIKRADSELSPIEKLRDYIKQIKNPYYYKCGKATVRISYSDTKETMEDRFQGFLLSL